MKGRNEILYTDWETGTFIAIGVVVRRGRQDEGEETGRGGGERTKGRQEEGETGVGVLYLPTK